MDKYTMLLFLLLFIFSFLPQRDDFYYARTKDMLIIRTFVNLLYCIIGFFVYLIFFVHQNTLIFMVVYGFIFIFLILFEHYVFVLILQNYIKKRITTIPNFMNMTEGQIRNELINMFDEIYDIDSIKKVLKKIGYYDI